MSVAVTLYTPEDLLAMPDGKRFELVGWQLVMVYRGDGSVSRLRENDELSGEDVVPGFRCPVRDLFPERKVAPSPITPNGSQ